VAYVYDEGLMTGTTAAIFSPDMSVSRSMFVTMLYRLAGSPGVDASVSMLFGTARDGMWYPTPSSGPWRTASRPA
jgi:hypothetical protein